jgi:hypothetical protein
LPKAQPITPPATAKRTPKVTTAISTPLRVINSLFANTSRVEHPPIKAPITSPAIAPVENVLICAHIDNG